MPPWPTSLPQQSTQDRPSNPLIGSRGPCRVLSTAIPATAAQALRYAWPLRTASRRTVRVLSGGSSTAHPCQREVSRTSRESRRVAVRTTVPPAPCAASTRSETPTSRRWCATRASRSAATTRRFAAQECPATAARRVRAATCTTASVAEAVLSCRVGTGSPKTKGVAMGSAASPPSGPAPQRSGLSRSHFKVHDALHRYWPLFGGPAQDRKSSDYDRSDAVTARTAGTQSRDGQPARDGARIAPGPARRPRLQARARRRARGFNREGEYPRGAPLRRGGHRALGAGHAGDSQGLSEPERTTASALGRYHAARAGGLESPVPKNTSEARPAPIAGTSAKTSAEAHQSCGRAPFQSA